MKTRAEELYQDILSLSRPDDPAFFRKHPRMPLSERAKIFAPFAALRGHSERLSLESGRLLRSAKVLLTEEESSVLSEKLSQAARGSFVTLTRFLPESPGSSMGYYVPLSGIVREVDPISQVIRIASGEYNDKGEVIEAVHFGDIADLSFAASDHEDAIVFLSGL